MRKLWLISKFMTSQTKQQIITIHILPNISRRKGNQIMEFGQSIKYNIENIFLEKLYLEELVPNSFIKKPKLNMSLD